MPVNNNLEKLNKIITAFDEESLTKSDFISSFEKVVELVLKVQKDQSTAIAKLEETYNTLLNKMQSDHSTTYADMRKSVDKLFVGERVDGMTKEHLARMAATDKKLAEAEAKIRSLKNGQDGLPGPRGKGGSPDNAGNIRTKLEALKGEDRLDKSAIRGLDDIEKKIEKASKMERTRVLAGPNANAVQSYDISSQFNGALKTFYVPRHRTALMLISTTFPIIYRPVVDFTTANISLTLTSAVVAPPAGQTGIFLYVK